MKYSFSFEKLEVWQEARLLTKEIYIVTKEFPDNEKFGIINQMRRAAISVSSNIAEGSSRTSTKDQANFYQISYSSLMELLNQLIISNDLNMLSSEKLAETRIRIEKISRMLNSLRKTRLKG
jgi:four helix bundle protein